MMLTPEEETLRECPFCSTINRTHKDSVAYWCIKCHKEVRLSGGTET